MTNDMIAIVFSIVVIAVFAAIHSFMTHEATDEQAEPVRQGKRSAMEPTYILDVESMRVTDTRKISDDELVWILAHHIGWLNGHKDGVRADFSNMDLSGKNLRGAILAGAILNGTDLRKANLTHVDLRGASLIGTDLRGTDLTGAKLM